MRSLIRTLSERKCERERRQLWREFKARVFMAWRYLFDFWLVQNMKRCHVIKIDQSKIDLVTPSQFKLNLNPTQSKCQSSIHTVEFKFKSQHSQLTCLMWIDFSILIHIVKVIHGKFKKRKVCWVCFCHCVYTAVKLGMWITHSNCSLRIGN